MRVIQAQRGEAYAAAAISPKLKELLGLGTIKRQPNTILDALHAARLTGVALHTAERRRESSKASGIGSEAEIQSNSDVLRVGRGVVGQAAGLPSGLIGGKGLAVLTDPLRQPVLPPYSQRIATTAIEGEDHDFNYSADRY